MRSFKHCHGFRKLIFLFSEIITSVKKCTERWKLRLGKLLSVHTSVFTGYFLRCPALHTIKQAPSKCCFPALQLTHLLSLMKIVLCHRTWQATYKYIYLILLASVTTATAVCFKTLHLPFMTCFCLPFQLAKEQSGSLVLLWLLLGKAVAFPGAVRKPP